MIRGRDYSNTNDSKKETKIIVNSKFDIYFNNLQPYVDENKTLEKEMFSKAVRMTYNYIQIGNILTKAKKDLSKDDFDKLINKFDINIRTVYRYIEIVKDDRIADLTIEQLSVMLNPSVGKLKLMRKLNNDGFNSVLSGDETPLLELSPKKDKNKSNPFKNKIDDETYNKLIKMDKDGIIEYYITIIKEKDDLYNELVEDRETLINIVKTNNLYEIETNNSEVA
jgi:chaperonin cofactor prefoldin